MHLIDTVVVSELRKRERHAGIVRLLDGEAVDTPVARRWGRLSARIGHGGADLLIAATALEHGLTVVTRNVRDFLATGVPVEDPFQDSA